MSSTQTSSERASKGSTGVVDMKLEVVVIPVSDVDRAKAFYGGLGWRLDADFAAGDDFRIVQFTPPGSGCSIQFGKGLTSAAPGSAQGLYLIVSDIEAARDELVGARRRGQRGVPRGDAGRSVPRRRRERRVGGPAPERSSYGSFATFSDPDGNGWLLQEVTTRLPGRIDPADDGVRLGERPGAARSGARRRRTASTRSGPARRTRTGPTGTPSTWCAEQAGEELPT